MFDLSRLKDEDYRLWAESLIKWLALEKRFLLELEIDEEAVVLSSLEHDCHVWFALEDNGLYQLRIEWWDQNKDEFHEVFLDFSWLEPEYTYDFDCSTFELIMKLIKEGK